MKMTNFNIIFENANVFPSMTYFLMKAFTFRKINFLVTQNRNQKQHTRILGVIFKMSSSLQKSWKRKPKWIQNLFQAAVILSAELSTADRTTRFLVLAWEIPPCTVDSKIFRALAIIIAFFLWFDCQFLPLHACYKQHKA